MSQDIKHVRDAFLFWPPSATAGTYGPGGDIPRAHPDAPIISAKVSDNSLVFRVSFGDQDITTTIGFKDTESRELIIPLLDKAPGKTIRELG